MASLWFYLYVYIPGEYEYQVSILKSVYIKTNVSE
jgi:hypothetical protein